MWQSYDDGMYRKAVDKGYIEDLGKHTATGREDWWYPKYVEKLCPGLPNWQALKKCSAIFSGDNGSKKGVFYTGPWNYRDGDLIRSLELNFSIKRFKNSEQLWQKLLDAKKKKQAIVLLNWTPNWVDVRINGDFIKFPAFEKACETDPDWGTNKEMLHDCGNPLITFIKKAAWPGLKERWPCLYQLVQQVNFTTDMIAEASALIGYEHLPEQQAIDIWLDKYALESKGWLNFTCAGF